MGIFDRLLVQIGSCADAQTIADRLGLSAGRVEKAIAALGAAHSKAGDTVETAAASSGIPSGELNQIVDELGGVEALLKFSCLLGQGPRGNPLVDKLSDLYGN